MNRHRAALAFTVVLIELLSIAAYAGQSKRVTDGVYSDEQARRGQGLYKGRCSTCHGETLGGGLAPPLAGDDFIGKWSAQPLSELAAKIQNTMPANEPGKLTPQQSADLTAYILQVGKFPAGKAELASDETVLKQVIWPTARQPQPQQVVGTAAAALLTPPLGNLAQVMRGILFPSSNLIFNVQSWDPGTLKPEPAGSGGSAGFSWVDWGAGIYKGWELVDYAAVALAESAPLMLTPGRRCENGKPVPVERSDWVKFAAELADAGRAAYKASQSRKQEVVSDVTEQVATACLHCHEVYRDKPGGTVLDPSNKAARCVP